METPSQSVEFRALQYALFVTCFVEVIGGGFFLMTTKYIIKDKQKVDRAIAGMEHGNILNFFVKFQLAECWYYFPLCFLHIVSVSSKII